MSEKDYGKYFRKPNMKEAARRGRQTLDVIDFDMPSEAHEIGKNKKYMIETYGCQMNVHDTEVMAGIFHEMGFEYTEDENETDIILLNTCAIRENAENKVFGKIGNFKKLKLKNPDLVLGVCGCMPQEEYVVERILEKYPQIDIIFGTHNIHQLPKYIINAYLSKEKVVDVWSQEGDIIERVPMRRAGNTKAWVNIMYGCDEFCTYCIVPYTRGRERSRNPEDIIDEVKQLAINGFKEVTLLGQNVNAYGNDFKDNNYGFADLLDDLNKTDIKRIRFTTSHPRDFNDKTIEVLAKRGNLMEHIHLPVQSGNTEVLKRMNRKYTREQYIELVKKIKKAIPDVSLTTDIIVGFPNETEEQFQDTLSLVEEAGFEGAYTFVYSPREGTPAARMNDNVPLEEKKDRLQRLNDLINKKFLEAHKKFVGKTVEVLVEGTSKNDDDMLTGYTRHNKLVNFKGPKSAIGKIVNVRVTEGKTWFVLGEMIDE